MTCSPATYYDSEEAMRVAEEMMRENKKTKETREEEFPRLASSSSFSGSHFQNCCALISSCHLLRCGVLNGETGALVPSLVLFFR